MLQERTWDTFGVWALLIPLGLVIALIVWRTVVAIRERQTAMESIGCMLPIVWALGFYVIWLLEVPLLEGIVTMVVVSAGVVAYNYFMDRRFPDEWGPEEGGSSGDDG
jgi:drug/metabolite transporter (DMT)-like permease